MESKTGLLLEEFVPEPELVVEEHAFRGAKFPAVDAHTHLGRFDTAEKLAELVAEMDRWNVRAIVDLATDRNMPFTRTIQLRKEKYPGRFLALVPAPFQQALAEGGDIGGKLARALEQAVKDGADGLKVYKSLGLRLRDDKGKLVMPDDPRIAALFAKCGELKVPCLIHVADPTAFFKPLSGRNERYEELVHHPDWQFVGGDLPSYQQLMESQERLVEQHPGTTFMSAHVASSSENLGYVGRLLDRYPNLYVDTSARLGELGRQPYTARAFIVKYADRVLFGTDDVGRYVSAPYYFRCFETRDEYFPYDPSPIPPQGRWRIYGLDLPDDVLEKVYFRNAQKMFRRWGASTWT